MAADFALRDIDSELDAASIYYCFKINDC